MPSVEDGLANGLLEGMALGLCPVVSDIFSDVVTDMKTGFVVPRGNTEALANALERAAKDKNLRSQFAAAANLVVTSRYSPEREADEYIQNFKNLGIM
jgi:glycosyltransferase involved in cell wall biosynthesis